MSYGLTLGRIKKSIAFVIRNESPVSGDDEMTWS